MTVSRCCKSEVEIRETVEGDYWSCKECKRACETFSVLVLNDSKYGWKDETNH